MRRKRIATWLLVVLLSLSLILPGVQPVQAETAVKPTVLETDVETASEGCTMLGVYGSYYSQAQEALDKLNEIRKEACNAGNVPDPRDPSRMRMLSPSDYKPLKWSRDLESVARIRATEGGIARGFMDSGHDRLNDKGTFSISYNGVSSWAEDLAYYQVKEMEEGILLWYSEKKDWVDQVDGKVTGHYTSMINPKYNYVGLGDFYSETAKYPNTLAGEFSIEEQLDETMQEAPADVMQKIEVSKEYIKEIYLDGKDSITTDQTMTVAPKVLLQRKKAQRNLWLLGSFTFTSSDPKVATVDDNGMVTGITDGTTTITARSEDGAQVVSLEVAVHCNHVRKLQSYTPATCVHTGEKVYYCETCDKSVTEELPKAAHDYVYGEVGADQKATGVCSVCQDTITISPPTDCRVYWRSSASDSMYYQASLPAKNPVGSVLYCWPQVSGGDSAYQDMVVESMDTAVISVPDSIVTNGSINELKVQSPGITTLTVYPKYNSRLKKTYTVRVGDAGSVDLTLAKAELSQDTYAYTGEECTPKVTVSYNGTVLKQGTDYTLQYEDNRFAGKAQAIVEGKGIFKGRIEKPFTIEAAASDTHTHTPVVDEKVEPTCTEPGKTQGSHCAECGEVLTAQQPIAATGHRYVNGKCSICGNVIYVEQDGLRYTLQDDLKGDYQAVVTAQPDAVIGETITIPARISDGTREYPVTTIGKNAFAGQKALTTVTVPDTVTEMQSGAFADCTALKDITFLGKTAPSVAEDVWTGTDTTALTIHAYKNSRGYDAMAERIGASIDKMQPPKHVHTMEFHDAKEPTCTKAGNIAYYTCKDCGKYFTDAQGQNEILRVDTVVHAKGHDWETEFTIDVPATAQKDGKKSIHCKRCSARRDVTTYSLKAQQKQEQQKNQTRKNSKNTANSSGSSAKSKTVATPSKTTVKKGEMFVIKGLWYRVTVVTGNQSTGKVTCVGSTAQSLKKAAIPKQVTYKKLHYTVTGIGKQAFAGQKKLQSVSIPASVTKIGAQAFFNCKKLKKVKISSSKLTRSSVGKKAFAGIAKKVTVTVPRSKKAEYRKWFSTKGLKM